MNDEEKKEFLERDNFRCVACGSPVGLEVYPTKNGTGYETLCSTCKRKRGYGLYWGSEL